MTRNSSIQHPALFTFSEVNLLMVFYDRFDILPLVLWCDPNRWCNFWFCTQALKGIFYSAASCQTDAEVHSLIERDHLSYVCFDTDYNRFQDCNLSGTRFSEKEEWYWFSEIAKQTFFQNFTIATLVLLQLRYYWLVKTVV